MKLELWPIVSREALVRAFRPGAAASLEAPFRTLRRQSWATAGVNVVTRTAGRASGRVTIFSVLNVVAARRAREGDDARATALAKAARRIEHSRDFRHLQKLLTGRSVNDVLAAVDGSLAADEQDELEVTLRRIGRDTDALRALGAAGHAEVLTGTVVQTRGDAVLLKASSGTQTWLPRWLAEGVHRESVGDVLALLTERVDDQQLVVRALPALNVASGEPAKSPFGRRAHALNTTDEALLRGRAEPLKVLVPVTIGA